ncbi:MAG: PilZ domain-containing protein [Deltaproteobacteria bacterium]|nr:PilZ domain-containing protein [Deltaproteobacteria bacterium]
MGNIYAGMSVGMGFILFCIVISFIWIIFKNYARGAFPNKNADQLEFYGYQADENRYEQRKVDQRAEVAWPVFIKTRGGIIKAVIRDINRSGAFIKCDSPCKPKERFRILIKSTEKRSILLNAEVVWSNVGIPEERVINRGMGIRFIKNPDKNLTALKLALDGYSGTEKMIPLQQASSL